MSVFKYKVNKGDVLKLGDGNQVEIEGVLTSYEKVASTASGIIDPLKAYTMITSAGAHTITLADGENVGQLKKIVITSVAAGTITVTPANLSDGTSLTMAEILDSVTLIWDGTSWNIAEASGIAIV